MKAWWFNEDSYAKNPDQRLPHTYEPNRPVSVDELKKLGLHYWQIPTENWEPQIDAVAAEREYKNRDRLNVTKEGLGDQYESKLKMFFNEHLHEDEEIRYIFEGSGYFDVREIKSDQWIRIMIEPSDLLVLPAGIYHRFTLDENNSIKVLRLFKDEPKWTPHNRSDDTESNPYRLNYVREVSSNA
ncbi:Acireductone dioxygenase [Clavulina sp. PMI_390]|nr:Acireductone dioxygenase [Clavulina sp. PMI_390]